MGLPDAGSPGASLSHAKDCEDSGCSLERVNLSKGSRRAWSRNRSRGFAALRSSIVGVRSSQEARCVPIEGESIGSGGRESRRAAGAGGFFRERRRLRGGPAVRSHPSAPSAASVHGACRRLRSVFNNLNTRSALRGAGQRKKGRRRSAALGTEGSDCDETSAYARINPRVYRAASGAGASSVGSGVASIGSSVGSQLSQGASTSGGQSPVGQGAGRAGPPCGATMVPIP